jgi:hypothetical protein
MSVFSGEISVNTPEKNVNAHPARNKCAFIVQVSIKSQNERKSKRELQWAEKSTKIILCYIIVVIQKNIRYIHIYIYMLLSIYILERPFLAKLFTGTPVKKLQSMHPRMAIQMSSELVDQFHTYTFGHIRYVWNIIEYGWQVNISLNMNWISLTMVDQKNINMNKHMNVNWIWLRIDWTILTIMKQSGILSNESQHF